MFCLDSFNVSDYDALFFCARKSDVEQFFIVPTLSLIIS